MPSRSTGTGPCPAWLVMNGSRTNASIAQRRSHNTSAVAYCVRRPSALGSATRRCEPVAHAERVQRDRVGPFIAGHERVANEGEHSTAKRSPNTELWRTV